MSKIALQPFIRVIANDKQVVGINPAALATFNAEVQAIHTRLKAGTVPNRAPNGALMNPATDFEQFKADCIRFVFKDGKGLTYIVGDQITQVEFEYVCECLLELTYKTRAEKIVAEETENAAKLEAFNKEASNN